MFFLQFIFQHWVFVLSKLIITDFINIDRLVLLEVI